MTVQVWIVAPEEEVAGFDPARKYDVFHFNRELKSVALVYLRTGRTPSLTPGEFDSWVRGLAMVGRIARGSRNQFHGHEDSPIGPWLQELCGFCGRSEKTEFGGDSSGARERNPAGLARESQSRRHGSNHEWVGPGGVAPRIVVRGILERFGAGGWNVLVGNVEEVARFWEEQGIKTRLDWAGMTPPKATVGRREFLEACHAAG